MGTVMGADTVQAILGVRAVQAQADRVPRAAQEQGTRVLGSDRRLGDRHGKLQPAKAP